AARPKARVFLRAGDLLAEFGREFAVDGRGVDADLFEDAPAHHRHQPAATLSFIAQPVRALEAPRRPRGLRPLQRLLDPLEGAANAVAQFIEPGARRCLLVLDVRWQSRLDVR